ncbi:MAG: hypothetical protein ACI4HI_18350 [Lachnospiraceae bacterium]
MNEYEMYEKKCENIRNTNEELLKIFEMDMSSLSEKTRNKHLSNVDFYINEYLLYEDTLTVEDGVVEIDGFLGDFFIRKCMWSTPASIKSTAESIKKFYKCMVEHGKIEKNDYEYLCESIKSGMPQWQSDCEQYNDPDEENPFVFPF